MRIEVIGADQINIRAMPEYKQIELGKATYEAILRFLEKPGGKEYLDKKIETAIANGEIVYDEEGVAHVGPRRRKERCGENGC